MARVGLFMVLCVAAVMFAGCGTRQEAPPATPAEAQKQSGPSVPVTAPAAWPVSPLERFVIIERRADSTKAYNFYVDEVAQRYVKTLEEAVKHPDGFRWVSAYLDSSRPVYAAEKKRIEECYAQGIKLRLVECELASSTKKGRILEEKPYYILTELKVHVKYIMEYTYPDNWIVKRAERKVFTLEQAYISERKEGKNFEHKREVVITAIEDDTEPPGEGS
ncbi:hypothetical protein [Anaeroselena agilis]|uniref:Lipoprotein n=1 Tax=Anaeroselena agilis TaxID=3063788 RepID=A0ABU3NVC1_9FIRM|nr:hypothetical protein [Selenomonadales bacterium 4137-cl]